jgi:hypothetical protein
MTAPVPLIVAQTVDMRDDNRCVRCMEWIRNGSRHHRKLRSQGGENTAQNLILLCGSGTTGCHGWVHSHISEAIDAGYICPSWREPENWPLKGHRQPTSPVQDTEWCQLTTDGQREWISAQQATYLREVL